MDSPQIGRVKLEALGWTVEERTGHLVARLEHRKIMMFEDGRVEFRDPTIRARYEMDAEWLQASRVMWPTVRF